MPLNLHIGILIFSMGSPRISGMNGENCGVTRTRFGLAVTAEYPSLSFLGWLATDMFGTWLSPWVSIWSCFGEGG